MMGRAEDPEGLDAEEAWSRLEERSLARLPADEQEAYDRIRSVFPVRGRPRQDLSRIDPGAEPLTSAQRQAQLRIRHRLLELMVADAGYRTSADLAAALLREPANLARLHEVRGLAAQPALVRAIEEGRATVEDVRSSAEEVLRTAYRRWRLPPHPGSASWYAFTPLGPLPIEIAAASEPRGLLIVQPLDDEGRPHPLQTEPADFAYFVRLDVARFGCTMLVRREESWGFLAVFADALAAGGAARSIRAELARTSPPIHFRMALHVGELTSSLGGFPSRDLHVCEALLLMAGTDQVLVTAGAREAIAALPGTLVRHGRRVLPMPQIEEIYELDAPAGAALEQADVGVVFERMPSVPFVAMPELVGRGIAAVTQDRARIITLVGPGGSGATRVALQVAAALSREFSTVHYVDLAAVVDRTRVARVVAEVLQVRIQRPRLDVLASLVRYLRRRRALLVLDSCDRALVECRQLLTALVAECPTLTVLATAAEPLSLRGEITINLRPLSLPASRGTTVRLIDVDSSEAGRMFVMRAAQVNRDYRIADAEAAAVARVCGLVQGLAMAVELVAAMTAAETASPAALGRELEDYLGHQTGVPAPALPRDRLLQLAISWRLRKLREQSGDLERAVLLLSLFPSDFNVHAAQVICGATDVDLFARDLRTLVRQAFIQAVEGGPAGPRYRMPESIRLECEARRRYDETLLNEVEGARTRFAAHYEDVLQTVIDAVHGPDQQRWIEVLKREIPNLRAALVWSQLATGRSDTWAKLAGAYARFLLQVGYTNESEEIVEDGLRRWQERDQVRLNLLAQAGLVAWRLGDNHRARQRWSEAVELAAEVRDLDGLARAEDELGMLAIGESDLAEASRRCHAGLGVATRIGSLSRLSFSRFHLGLIAIREGDLVSARQHLEASLAMRLDRAHPNRLRVASTRLGLAELAVAESRAGLAGSLAEGREHLRQALRTYAEGHDRLGIASALSLCVVLLAAQREWEGAVRLDAAAHRILDSMGQTLPHIWHSLVVQAAASARAALSERGLQIADERGGELDDGEAVAYAQTLLAAPGISRAEAAGTSGPTGNGGDPPSIRSTSER